MVFRDHPAGKLSTGISTSVGWEFLRIDSSEGVALPRDHTEYMRGRRRHALRTNLRRAATAGITCEVVSDRQRVDPELTGILRRHWRHLPEAELHAWRNRFRARVTRPGTTVMVARAHDDRALAVLAATVDDSVCGIGFAMATCHEARWALHDHLVRALIARRVRYVLAEDMGLSEHSPIRPACSTISTCWATSCAT